MMLSVMALNTTNSFEQNSFHFIERHLSDLRHADVMHAQNGDMSVLPSLQMEL